MGFETDLDPKYEKQSDLNRGKEGRRATLTLVYSKVHMSKQSVKKKFPEPGTRPGPGGRRRVHEDPSHETSRPLLEEPATGETPNIKREFILTQSADDTLHDLLRLISRSTSTNPTNSQLLRVLLKVIEHAVPGIEQEFSQVEPLKQPSNARGRERERDEFEWMLASFIVAAIRKSDPL